MVPYFFHFSHFYVWLADRLHDFEVRLMDIPPDSGMDQSMLCGKLEGVAGYITTLNCDPPTKGRYLVITIPGNSERLTLCEVEVYRGKIIF